MSNDTKFWLWRILMIAILVVSASLLSGIVPIVMSGSGNVWFLAIPFFITIVAGIFVSIKYYLAKAQRWEDPQPLGNDLETLAAYAKLETEEKKKVAEKPKPPY